MRVEHDVCAMPGGPSDRFRIAPTLVTDGNTEHERAGLKNLPPGSGRIRLVLRGVELDLVLEASDRSVSIDDQCGDQEGGVDDAFGAENNGEVRSCGGCRNDGPCAFEEHRVRGRHRLPAGPVTGNQAFRKADDGGAFDGRLSDRVFRQHDGLRGIRRNPDVGECDAEGAHSSFQLPASSSSY
jgi:hypothetical protein